MAPAWAQDIQGQLVTQATRGTTVASGGTMGNRAFLYGGNSALAPVTSQSPSRRMETTPVILTERI